MQTLKQWMRAVSSGQVESALSVTALMLAKMASEDSDFPNVIPTPAGFIAMKDYLGELKASPDAMAAFAEIGKEYAARSGWMQYQNFKRID